MSICTIHCTKDLNFLLTNNHTRLLGIELFDHPALKDTKHDFYHFHEHLIRLEQFKALDPELFGKDLPVYLKVSHNYNQTVLSVNILLDSVTSNYYKFCNFYMEELNRSLKRVERHWDMVCKRFKWHGYSPFSFVECRRDDAFLCEDLFYSDFPESNAYAVGRVHLIRNPRFSEE